MRFRPGLAMTVFVLFFLPLTLALGLWQLNRAEEKNQLLSRFDSRTAAAPTDWSGQTPPPAGTAVTACVDWPGDIWFLDNRTFEGRTGYDVYLPVQQCGTGRSILLRLGWIEGLRERTDLPSITGLAALQGETGIRGQVRPPVGTPWLTAEPEGFPGERWRIQSLTDVPKADWGGGTPIVQLEEPVAPRLRDNWKPVNMPPERHIGYAVQWFGLAAVLVLGFLIWGYKGGKQTVERSRRDG